jgi:hypothetical protein
VNSEKARACLTAFNTVCSYIGTRDLVQEHIAFKVWPLVNKFEMPKETTAGSREGGLVYLKYPYRYRNQFGEPDDEWLDAIEATSEELLGAYTKAEDEATNAAFGARGKIRFNKVFDVIGFVYPNYCFLAKKHGVKRKLAAATSSIASKPKKSKVLTHRSKSYFLERAAILPTAKTSKLKTIEAVEEALPSSEVTARVPHPHLSGMSFRKEPRARTVRYFGIVEGTSGVKDSNHSNGNSQERKKNGQCA